MHTHSSHSRLNAFGLRLYLRSTCFSVVFSLLQERAFTNPGFTFSGFATFVQYLTYALCARSETILSRGSASSPPDSNWAFSGPRLHQYILVATTGMIGLFANNAALVYIDYITKIICKSAKVLPVFIFSTLIQGRTYTASFILAVLLFASGLVAFLSGESALPLARPVFNSTGVAFILISLLADSLHCNLEERFFFKTSPKPVDSSEILEVTSLMASVTLLVVTAATGELQLAFSYVSLHPHVLISLILSSASGFLSASLALTLIRHFGSGNCEIAKSLRKIFQVMGSVVVFGKTLRPRELGGLAVVFLALTWIHRMYSRPGKASGEGTAAGRAPAPI